jgi:hypothetical protein
MTGTDPKRLQRLPQHFRVIGPRLFPFDFRPGRMPLIEAVLHPHGDNSPIATPQGGKFMPSSRFLELSAESVLHVLRHSKLLPRDSSAMFLHAPLCRAPTHAARCGGLAGVLGGSPAVVRRSQSPPQTSTFELGTTYGRAWRTVRLAKVIPPTLHHQSHALEFPRRSQSDPVQ